MRLFNVFGHSAIIAVFAFVIVSCSSTNPGSLEQPTRDAAGFTVSVLPESFIDNSSVDEFSIETEDMDEGVMVNVLATGARNLKALYLKMEYDAADYRPMIGVPTDAMAPGDEVVKLQYFREPGTVHYGQAVIDPLNKSGFSGTGVVARVLFKKEEALSLRQASLANTGPLSGQLVDADVTTNMTWWYASQGDYDQNREVNVADLTPIVLNFGETGPWTDNFSENVVDGDGNDEINAADITPIALYFGATSSEFHIYSSANPDDYPAAGTDVLTVAHADGVNDPTGGRLQFTVPMNDPGFGNLDPNDYYWVFPSDGTTNGTISNRVGGPVADQPTLALTNPPATGDGTNGNPYVAVTLTDYVFSLTDPVDGDVSTDPLTTYVVSDAGAGAIANTDATLNIPDGYDGTFNITASYDGTPNRADTTIYMRVDAIGPGGLFILPDPSDTDWGGVTGTGADVANPFVLGEVVGDGSGFNEDFSVEFSFIANEASDGSGLAINVNDLTWMAIPPFVVDWTGAGSFNANMFTSEYLWAQDSESNNSNLVYIVHHSLPVDP